jgi:hypothetical protein
VPEKYHHRSHSVCRGFHSVGAVLWLEGSVTGGNSRCEGIFDSEGIVDSEGVVNSVGMVDSDGWSTAGAVLNAVTV